MTDTSFIWNSVHDALVLDGVDRDEAKRRADHIVQSYGYGTKYGKPPGRWTRFRKWWEWGAFWWTVFTILAVGGLAFGIFSIAYWARSAYSYGGYQPKSVRNAAAQALQQWYGENDLPPQLQLKTITESRWFGRDAWKVNYRTLDGKPICAYVWHYAGPDAELYEHRVEEGANCR